MLRVRSSVVVVLAMMLSVTLLVRPASAQQAGRVAPVRGQQARLVLTEVLRIGSEMDPDDSFGRVSDVVLGRNGRVYVLDDINRQISVFDSTGRLLRRAGRQGEGPGEYELPWWMAVDARDSVFVWDWKQARVSVLSPDLRYVRSFPPPERWSLNGFDVLPDGSLMVAGYSPTNRGTIHYLSRTGRVLRSFGPTPNRAGIPDAFVSPLLGGAVDVGGASLVYTNKSPYQLHFFGLDGRPRGRCDGDPNWTTRPEAVVTVRGSSQSFDFGAYVRSSHVFEIGNGLYLNVIADLKRNRRTFDLVRSDCVLLERRTVDQNIFFMDRLGDRLAAVVENEIPQVVIYRFRVASSR